jgi:glucosylceramidase
MHPRRRSAALILGVAAVSCAALTTAGLAATAAPKPAASPAPGARPVTWVLTTPDRRQLLATQPATTFGPNQPTYYSWSDIRVDDAKRFQKVQGVGAALTESSAVLLDQLPAATRTQVLTRLFSRTTGAGIGVVRVPFGASDFSLSDYTFDDMPWGQTDPTLARFSIDRDRAHLVPLLTAAQRLNPPLTVVATPWSAPAWMKTNINTHDGQLAPAWEDAYARYLAKAVTAYRAAGAPVRAVTVVNEPSASRGWSPSMPMGAAQQARFVGEHLRPALDAAGLKGFTILGFDHSWNDTAYPTSLLTGPYAGAFTGAAFHCYAGDASAQSRVAAAAPGKQMWTTECSGGTWSPDFATNLRWNAHHMLIGPFRNSSTAVLWFNLALDPQGGPTNGGCTNCRGVLTVDPATNAVSYNVEYWLLSHIGRYVSPGAVRVDSTASNSTGVQSVAFLNPDGSHALVLYNEGGTAQPVTVRWAGKAARVQIPSGAVATLRW